MDLKPASGSAAPGVLLFLAIVGLLETGPGGAHVVGALRDDAVRRLGLGTAVLLYLERDLLLLSSGPGLGHTLAYPQHMHPDFPDIFICTQ